MKNLILVDGNNLLFRSYYATAYNGNFMKNSKGFPTNALFGFTNMINKIITEEKPTHIIVAFDKGKTFRHEKYSEYKGGRGETPIELKQQFPVAKQMLTYMGITYYEIDNYEADDIIGTFAKFCEEDDNFTGTIISSDKDLLQLISKTVDIKLLKSKDYIRYNEKTFKEDYGIEPINVIDLKALMGDSSDNIPGVKGIGEKTALKLLGQYKTLDGIYENIENISKSTKTKLINDKKNAYMSYEIATIYKEVPLKINIEDLIYKGKDNEKLNKLYEDLEFYSFLKKEEKIKEEKIDTKIVKNINEINITNPCAINIEIKGKNYHEATILGMSIYNKENSLYIPLDILKQNPSFLTTIEKYTYDQKKIYVCLKQNNINIENITFDTMISTYLLEYNIKEDIGYLMNQEGISIDFDETFYGKKFEIEHTTEEIANHSIKKAKFIYDTKQKYEEKINNQNMNELFKTIEMPLAKVLSEMEINGIKTDMNALNEMKKDITKKMEELTNEIHELAGEKFNIQSPKILGDILFEKLLLPHGKKGKTGYSTAVDVLNKLKGKHPIIEKILEYRMLAKLQSTYVEGLICSVKEDKKIHTIYNQALTRTGRLSSQEPNLQNIPARNEYGKLIRKAFIPENDIIISADYSQIELRILAHFANVETLIKAFNNNEDIHTKTASDIFKVEEVTKGMRRIAKAVNFGIIYGISSFGLSENLNITPKEAKDFIDKYLETYPGISKYMEETIKKAHEQGYVTTLFNRKRTIDELKNNNYVIRQSGERMALNTPIQGTSADIIKKAMVEVDKKMKEKKLKSKMILQIHDELVFDVKEDEQDILKQILIDCMENVCKLSVPLRISIETGKNLYEAK
ncbi:MAG: DNA polymerase I [Bacilli bacterium]|nr:DNA polymerase I [Bacilli bacterium]MBP3921304.1 DNA polymerase I [Bacilli bacterium]